MKRRILAAFTLACLLITAPVTQAAEEEFGIGSKAPAIDVEHWLSDGDGYFPHIKEFKPGHVYVVEFWATWCGPCIASMPHIAELQQKYRGQDVQIISISDEELDTVQNFLKQNVRGNNNGETYAELTSAYSLTTDPDGSVYKDYMEAANQNGIPTAFIVGKQGIIEWIGHPMRLDDADSGEPLAKVVDGTWDREKFKEEYEEQQRFEKVMQRVAMLAGTQKFDEAIDLIQKEVSNAKSPEMKEQLQMLLYNLKLSAGKIDESVVKYFEAQLEEMKDSPVDVGRFGYSIYSAMQNDVNVGPLADDAIQAIQDVVTDSPDQYKPFLYNQLAQLYEATDKLDQAVEAQKKAVDASEGRAQKRMQLYLEELQEKSGASSDKDEKSEASEK